MNELCSLNSMLPTIPTLIATISLMISYLNYRREQSRLAIECSSEYFLLDNNLIHNSLRNQFQDDAYIQEGIRIDVCNVGRRSIYINPPVLLWPTGENCSSPIKRQTIKLDEGQNELYFFPKNYIEMFSSTTFDTKEIRWKELQGLVVATSGKRWYSNSRNLKFIYYYLERKILKGLKSV